MRRIGVDRAIAFCRCRFGARRFSDAEVKWGCLFLVCHVFSLTAHECVFKMELVDVRAREWKRAGIDGDRGHDVVVLVSNDRF